MFYLITFYKLSYNVLIMHLNPVRSELSQLSSKGSAGFSLLELLITVAVLSFIAFPIISLNLTLLQQQVNSANLESVDIFRRNLASVILDDYSWGNTVKANSGGGLNVPSTGNLSYAGSMDCLLNSTSCTAGDHPFALLDGAGQLVYDGTNSSTGINFDGTLCSNNCPLRFNLLWSPICPVSGPCIANRVTVKGQLVINSSASAGGPAINPSRHSIVPDIIRSAK